MDQHQQPRLCRGAGLLNFVRHREASIRSFPYRLSRKRLLIFGQAGASDGLF